MAIKSDIDGLVQDYGNSIADTLSYRSLALSPQYTTTICTLHMLAA